MSQEDHKIIAKCKAKAQELVAAIEKYKSSAELNQTATSSLETVAKATKHAAGELAALSDYKLRRVILIFKIILGINTALLLIILTCLYYLAK